jgi:hypothetical protein
MAMDEFRSNTPSSASAGGTYSGTRLSRSSPRKWLLWLVVLLLLLWAAFWLADKTPNVMKQGGTSQEIAPGQTLTQAPEGSIVEGFPSKLILEENVAATQSYTIAYTDGNITQPVVSYRSKKTLTENVAAYGAYLALNGWNVTHEADATETVTFFYATQGTTDINVTFAKDSEGVMVTIAYVTRGE